MQRKYFVFVVVGILAARMAAAQAWTPDQSNVAINHPSGNVGVGVPDPLAKVHIGGGGEVLRLGDGTGDVFLTAHTTAGLGSLFLMQNINGFTQYSFAQQAFSGHNGSMGVGVPAWVASANGVTLAVGGKISFGSSYLAYLENIGLMVDFPTPSQTQMVVRGATGQSASLQEWQDNAGQALTKIDSAGKVTIGRSGADTATTQLSVNGSIHVTGNINAKYQDVAEWVAASSDLAAGTVVVLNPERDNEVMASTRAYDTTVAGVVSAQPGLILGEGAPTKETIATMGRVRVRVDATRAPIAIGDLLVTSDRPGYAMKSMPVDLGGMAMHRPGTILGKALQPLHEGEGEILVLLSMQ